MILEICAFNIQSCIIAAKAGANRIELCADPVAGGTTPSYGTVQYALEHINIPVFPMVRPRGGNFIYDKHELAIMMKDIGLFKKIGVRGIVTGALMADGRINADQLTRLVEHAYPMEVTCHKAFDSAREEALEWVIRSGCTRVLTSGLRKTATEGIPALRQLIAQADRRIIIMPGGGVRSSNIAQLAKETGATEFHSSALIARDTNHIADEQEIRSLCMGLGIEN